MMSLETETALLWSTPRLEAAEVARLRELLYTDLDWTRVLGVLATHRTMGVAWYNTLEHLIEERGALRPTYFFKGPEVTFKGQRIMAEEQITYSLELFGALGAAGVPCAMLKGGAVASMAYPSLGMRVFNDNDVLVPHSRLAEVGVVMKELGYEQGSWDYAEAKVRPARRSDVILFAINSHQTHPYSRPTPRAATLECHRVDIHFSVDLLTPNRTDDLVSDLLDRRVPVGDPPLWALHQHDMFILACVHYFKEATHHHEVARLKDLVLYKLIDLLAMLTSHEFPLDIVALVSRIRQIGYERPVYFALSHLAELFPARVPPGLAEELRPASTDYVHEVLDEKGRTYRWTTPLATRFFDALRARDLVMDGELSPRS
ncbi:nucleotidyltransferase family protein [Sphaerisporangium fuscum]|uniref:nucleotidyltransferase family protein n=1 Tax=Sphaerisporangium fuscum TaxID=2835868 RepID=UPI001BDC8D76|nr:nucleotidyltransferase family protein [Sphaerisporangium fuscum]